MVSRRRAQKGHPALAAEVWRVGKWGKVSVMWKSETGIEVPWMVLRDGRRRWRHVGQGVEPGVVVMVERFGFGGMGRARWR
jgi:hypothetical protein